MIYNGYMIADIHFGAMDSKVLFSELESGFIKKLKENADTIHFIVICGDLFHNKLNMNSSHAKYAFKFLQIVIDICIENNIKLRILKGTEFHDNRQLDLVPYLYTKNCDIRIISTVTEEYLFEDLCVLYLPEEYMDNMEDFYKEYFNNHKKYDMVFGHGMIEEVSFAALSQTSEITMKKAPVYSSKVLKDICRGPIFFGHIHTAQQIKETIYYIGSYSRWVFGEERPKGFMEVLYDTSNSIFKVEYIFNNSARKFETFVFETSDFYNMYEEDQYKKIITCTDKANDMNHIRCIFHLPNDKCDNPFYDMLPKSINNPYVKIIINKSGERNKKRREMNQLLTELTNKYAYLYDYGIPIEDKISRFIKSEYSKDISITDINKYLYNKEL